MFVLIFECFTFLMSLFPVPRVLAGLARLESVKETPGLRASLVLFSLLEKKTLMRVVTSLSLALIVLNCLFFFCFLFFFHLAAFYGWPWVFSG